MTGATPDHETYVEAIAVDDMFVDPSYQRQLDTNRARAMAQNWNRRLVGVLDVSDRGAPPAGSMAARFAIINGQHRWAAAGFRDPSLHLVCNVHSGLTPDQEAKLFYDIDRGTKKLTTWDRWHSRLAAGDPVVGAVVELAGGFDLKVNNQPGYHLQCVSTLESMYKADPEALALALEMIVAVWPKDRNALRGGIIEGLSRLFIGAPDLESGRLADGLSELTPAQVHARAVEHRANNPQGRFWCSVTRVIIRSYNRQPGRDKLIADDVIGGR
ncbi:DUF6551 family protein [Williamsia sp.]|uniref:DUF6551 family protein n=1 Tax=Williamsia sp. TaxID=1872085 RepID=UPI002F93DDBF